MLDDDTDGRDEPREDEEPEEPTASPDDRVTDAEPESQHPSTVRSSQGTVRVDVGLLTELRTAPP